MIPLVAIVGRPNVGKSTLFNRIAGVRKAIIEDSPGVTRDLNYVDVYHQDRFFTLLDTGGFEPVATDRLRQQIAEQCRLAVEEADAIIFLLDGKVGVTPTDTDIARLLRESERPVLYVINKIDAPTHEDYVYDFYQLGVDRLFSISALHNIGINDVLEVLTEQLPPMPSRMEALEGRIPIAVVGRPNVGKSSVVNRLLGYDRVIVHDTPGTTRDAVDTPFSVGDTPDVLIDTAGIRRKSRISLRLEKYTVVEAIRSIERADIVLLITDAVEGATDQDARIGSLIHTRGKGIILVANKWDLRCVTTSIADYTQQVRDRLNFLDFAPLIVTSAMTGLGFAGLVEALGAISRERNKQIATSTLNRWLKEVTEAHSPDLVRHQRVTLSYMTQIGTCPPKFLIFTNRPTGIKEPYRRYLVNQLRRKFGFEGTSIRLIFRKKH
jgi:GTP-binding protein